MSLPVLVGVGVVAAGILVCLLARQWTHSWRARREAALAARLEDEAQVAEACALALRRLGLAGGRQLELRAGDQGPVGDLVRRVLSQRL